MKKKSGFSVKIKLNIFVIFTVLIVALGTASFAFYTSINQIDTYYKQCAADNAKNFASLVDGDFLVKLRHEAESDEFQKLRSKAENEENETILKEYLSKHSLWEKYKETQDKIDSYLENMQDIKYLYIAAQGDENATQDMYLIDSSSEPVYETGYYEDREAELLGLDISALEEPTISNGDWGWLCSAFSPVYDSDGKCVCIVGCDFDMNDVMDERGQFRIYLFAGALVLTLIIQSIAMLLINKTVVRPLDSMTKEMKKFKPAENISYKEAGVMDLPIKGNDEIGAIYNGIRMMQTNIIDYLNDMLALQKYKQKAELDLIDKEKQIDQLSEENNTDNLTGVGSKSAYARKVEELNKLLSEGRASFALIMIDMNDLKKINDKYGHKAGDRYIKGCCSMVCDVFKNSLVYRVGGDEFIVVVQGSDYKNRKELFDRLKNTFEESSSNNDKVPWQRYSAAVGMAENGAADITVDFVFSRADKEMYDDKMRYKKIHGTYR